MLDPRLQDKAEDLAKDIDISRKYCEIAKERLIKEAKANIQVLV